MYSVILEINDAANNSEYVRRFVMFDPDSSITVENSQLPNRFRATTARNETNYKWQSEYTTGGATIRFTWDGYFRNIFHDDNLLLNAVKAYPPQLDDDGTRGFGYKHIGVNLDDNEGHRTTSVIQNDHSIVKYEFFYANDNNGGNDFPSSVPETQWMSLPFDRDTNKTIQRSDIRDGTTVGFWIRASDVMGNRLVKQTTVSFDMSPPTEEGGNPTLPIPIEITNNIENGTFPFGSRFV